MKTRIIFGLMLTLAAPLDALPRSSPSLGIAEGRCRPDEPGPALLITVTGLKDRKGMIKAELYPANDRDFLRDDNLLVGEGKTFRRAVEDLPESGPVHICIRAPAAGDYALVVLHDRNRDGKFDKSYDGDGLGFGGNPGSQGPFKPRIASARVFAGTGVTPVSVRMLYRQGLFSLTPLKRR